MKQFDKVKFTQHRSRSGKWIACETCKTIFYVTMARVRQTAKSGNQIRYCSMRCYRKDGALNPFWGKRHSDMTKIKWVDNPSRARFARGPSNPNSRRYADDYVGKSSGWWRAHLLQESGACEQCGWDMEPGVLQIHHIDRNRRNNARVNLLLLCPNCHEIHHFHTKDGGYGGGKFSEQQSVARKEVSPTEAQRLTK